MCMHACMPHLGCNLLQIHIRVIEDPLEGLLPLFFLVRLPLFVPARAPCFSGC